MPNVIFACPHCEGSVRAELEACAAGVACPNCQERLVAQAAKLAEGPLRRCVVCPSKELFVRKDFPQRLGVGIVVLGFGVSSIFWAYHNVIATFAVLFATALIDVVLYLTMGNVLECYRCHAQYRGLPESEQYDPFDLEAYEKHRQQALRMKEVRGSSEG